MSKIGSPSLFLHAFQFVRPSGRCSQVRSPGLLNTNYFCIDDCGLALHPKPNITHYLLLITNYGLRITLIQLQKIIIGCIRLFGLVDVLFVVVFFASGFGVAIQLIKDGVIGFWLGCRRVEALAWLG